MNEIYQAKAKVRYFNTWVIAFSDDGIIDYYSWWYQRLTGIKLMKPKNGSHISIVRGKEEDISAGLWEYNLDGPEIEFTYSHDFRDEYGYVWLSVEPYSFQKIRDDLGLTTKPLYGYHLTIGRKP